MSHSTRLLPSNQLVWHPQEHLRGPVPANLSAQRASNNNRSDRIFLHTWVEVPSAHPSLVSLYIVDRYGD